MKVNVRKDEHLVKLVADVKSNGTRFLKNAHLVVQDLDNHFVHTDRYGFNYIFFEKEFEYIHETKVPG